jgi:hypothetical protein
MRTKQFLVQMVRMAVLAVATAGVMPAGCARCKGGPNHTYAEQSSNGNVFDQLLAWIKSVLVGLWVAGVGLGPPILADIVGVPGTMTG